MEELLLAAGQVAAVRALGELAFASFGAIDELELKELAELSDEAGGVFWQLRWEATSLGLPHGEVSMVILPEFLEGDNAEPAWLAEQMAAFIVERLLNQAASEEEDEDNGDVR